MKINQVAFQYVIQFNSSSAFHSSKTVSRNKTQFPKLIILNQMVQISTTEIKEASRILMKPIFSSETTGMTLAFWHYFDPAFGCFNVPCIWFCKKGFALFSVETKSKAVGKWLVCLDRYVRILSFNSSASTDLIYYSWLAKFGIRFSLSKLIIVKNGIGLFCQDWRLWVTLG